MQHTIKRRSSESRGLTRVEKVFVCVCAPHNERLNFAVAGVAYQINLPLGEGEREGKRGTWLVRGEGEWDRGRERGTEWEGEGPRASNGERETKREKEGGRAGARRSHRG